MGMINLFSRDIASVVWAYPNFLFIRMSSASSYLPDSFAYSYPRPLSSLAHMGCDGGKEEGWEIDISHDPNPEGRMYQIRYIGGGEGDGK